MRHTLDDIKAFSFCPRYYSYSKKNTYSKSHRASIIDKTIRKAYARKAEYNRPSQWKSIIGWMDKEIYKNVDMDNEESFYAARKLAENILEFIQKWYQFDYIRTDNPTYIDIPISYTFPSDVVVGEIPILEVNEDQVLIKYIDELEYDNLKIYNDIKVMSWACWLIEQLDIKEIRVKHIFIGPKSGISSDPAIIKKSFCPRVREMVREIATSIRAGISYPSYTEMCYTCPFKKQCSI